MDSTRLKIPADQNPETGPKITSLRGNPEQGEISGTLLKIPADFTGEIRSDSTEFRAVVIEGSPQLQLAGATASIELITGSYFGTAKGATHQLASEKPSILYIRSSGRFELTQN